MEQFVAHKVQLKSDETKNVTGLVKISRDDG